MTDVRGALAELEDRTARSRRAQELARALLGAEALPGRVHRGQVPAVDTPASRAACRAVRGAVNARTLDGTQVLALQAATAGADGAVRGLRRAAGGVLREDGHLVFNGPEPAALPRALDHVVRHADQEDPVRAATGVVAALLAAHPFADGNGRTARLLLHVVLRRRGVLRQGAVPFGAVLSRNTSAVLTATRAWRAGDLETWYATADGFLLQACATSHRVLDELCATGASRR